MTSSTAVSVVVARYREVSEYVEKRAPTLEKLLPPGYPVHELITDVQLAISKNKELLECDNESLMLSVARCAQLQLRLGYTAHLVKFGRKCEMVVDYKGYIELMEAAGNRDVQAQVVYEGDDFDYQFGTDPYVRHKPRRFNEGEKRRILFSYASVAKRNSARPMFVILDRDAIEARRKKSPNWYKDRKTGRTIPLEDVGPWYAMKAAVRELAKWVPKNSRRLLLAVQQADVELEEPEAVTVDGELAAEVRKTEQAMESKGEPPQQVITTKKTASGDEYDDVEEADVEGKDDDSLPLPEY